MKQVVIENPVLNSPFHEPTRHFRFTDEGITNEIDNGRRISSYFVPIARPKKKGKQQSLFETEWTQDHIEENRFVNEVRRHVSFWRKGKLSEGCFYIKKILYLLRGNNFRHKERIKYVSYEPIAKVLKREEFVIPTKVGIQSFQHVAKISGFPFARE